MLTKYSTKWAILTLTHTSAPRCKATLEFMREAGVPDENIDSQRAYAVKAIWADYRDKGDDEKLIKEEGMIVALISQLKR